MKDLFGQAILDYQTNNSPEDIITETSISEEDELSIAYLFRDFNQMPILEKEALKLSSGKTLDIGCGAGSHSLYLQNEKELTVFAMDISPKAIEACELRGLKNTVCADVMEYQKEKFDTILLLMNGAGMCGRLNKMKDFLTHIKSLLNVGGQILVDSSDIIYMFDEDEDGGKWISTDEEYYGELVFNISYKNKKEEPFKWLYIDFNTLQNVANALGLLCELIKEGEHYDYLARLTHK